MKVNSTTVSLLLVAGAFLPACNERAPETSASESVSPPRVSSAPQEVVVFTWEEYFSEEAIASFEEKSGISVRFEYYENLGELIGRLRSEPEAFDVVVVDDVTLAEVIELKLLQPVDHNRVPNLDNFFDRYLDLEFDPANQFSIPYLWGTTLVAYRADMIEEPEPSWNLLWDSSLKGRVCLMDEKDDVYAAALLSLGKSLTDQNVADLSEATDKLTNETHKMDLSYRPLEEIKDRLISGECWAAILYSGDAAVISEEDENIAYFIPKEGAPIWMDNFAIPRNAPHVAEAHEFINYISDGKVAAENANYLWYATPNREATPHLNEELTMDESVNPPEAILKNCAFHPRPSTKRDRIINQGMKKIFDEVRAHRIASGSSEDHSIPEGETAFVPEGDSPDSSQDPD